MIRQRLSFLRHHCCARVAAMNYPPRNLTPIEMLWQELHAKKEEEAKRKAEEERKKQEELKKQLEMARGPTEGRVLVGGRPIPPAYVAPPKKEQHVLTNKRTTYGALVPVRAQFTACGSAMDFHTKSPVNESGEWINHVYDDSNDLDPKSTWRRLYDIRNGPIKNFVGKSKVMQSSGYVTSRLVAKGGLLKSVRNDGPFTLGVFLMNVPVSRSPDNVLYSERISNIKEAYYRSRKSQGNISLVTIVPPNSFIAFEDETFYKKDDGSAGVLSADEENVAATQQAWINVTKEDIKESIINPCAFQHPSGGDKVVYLKEGSALAKFLRDNMRYILQHLNESPVQPSYFQLFRLTGTQVFPKEIQHLIPPEDLDAAHIVVAAEERHVKMAKKLAYQMIERLPFENLEEHQFFIARLDGTSWIDAEGLNLTEEEIELQNQTQFHIGVELEMWFSVVTNERGALFKPEIA